MRIASRASRAFTTQRTHVPTIGYAGPGHLLPASLMHEASAALPEVAVADTKLAEGNLHDCAYSLRRAVEILEPMGHTPVLLPVQLRYAKVCQYRGEFLEEVKQRGAFLATLSKCYEPKDMPLAYLFGASSLLVALLRVGKFDEAVDAGRRWKEKAQHDALTGVHCDILSASALSVRDSQAGYQLLDAVQARTDSLPGRPTTGSYPHVPNVIRADLDLHRAHIAIRDGDYARAHAALERALKAHLDANKFEGDLPDKHAKALGPLVAYLQLADPSSLSSALKLIESELSDDPVALAVCLHRTAVATHIKGDPIVAEGLFRSAIAKLERPKIGFVQETLMAVVEDYAKLLEQTQWNGRFRAHEAEVLRTKHGLRQQSVNAGAEEGTVAEPEKAESWRPLSVTPAGAEGILGPLHWIASRYSL